MHSLLPHEGPGCKYTIIAVRQRPCWSSKTVLLTAHEDSVTLPCSDAGLSLNVANFRESLQLDSSQCGQTAHQAADSVQ